MEAKDEKITILIGPEGDFSPTEISISSYRKSFYSVTLENKITNRNRCFGGLSYNCFDK